MCVCVSLAEHVRGADIRGLLPPIPASPDRTLPGEPGAGGDDDHQGQEDPLLQHPEGRGGQREVRNGRRKDRKRRVIYDLNRQRGHVAAAAADASTCGGQIGDALDETFYSPAPQLPEGLGGAYIQRAGLP